MTIIEKISAARDTFFRANGFMPNTIKMRMADYRATLELGDPNINVGMRIVKRAGEMECAFDEAAVSSAKTIDGTCVHGNDFMTCAKCIPPIAKREFSGVPDTIKISMVNITPLAEWFRNQTAKEFEKPRLKFEQRIPNIGECGLVMIDNQTLFVTRTSQNYFHSYGNPSSGSTQILIEHAKEAVTDAVTLVRIDPSIEGDESVDQSTNSLKTGFRF